MSAPFRPFRVLAVALALVIAATLAATAQVKIEEVRTPGGLTAWLTEDHGLPFVALDIRFRGGTSLDPPEKRGATHLMAALLEEGAGERDSAAFADARDALGARFGFDASADAVLISALMLTENRRAAADLLGEALAAPRFDEDAVARVREQVLANIRGAAKDPARIASRAFDEMAFGDHPYAGPGEGTLASAGALRRDDVVAAWRAALTRDRVFIGAAGDITPDELATLLDGLLGALPASGPPPPPPAPWNMAGGTTVIDYPSPQSVVYFGQRGIRQSDPDFLAAYILNDILGGGRFSSRLMNEVREKRGLTYGIGTTLLDLDATEMVLGQFSASNDKTAEAITVIRDNWTRITRDGVTAEELAASKTYLTGAYPLRFDGNARIASILVGMQMEDLPIDYPATRNARVNAVTLDEVNAMARRLLDPEALHFVVVGRPVALAPEDAAGAERTDTP